MCLFAQSSFNLLEVNETDLGEISVAVPVYQASLAASNTSGIILY